MWFVGLGSASWVDVGSMHTTLMSSLFAGSAGLLWLLLQGLRGRSQLKPAAKYDQQGPALAATPQQEPTPVDALSPSGGEPLPPPRVPEAKTENPSKEHEPTEDPDEWEHASAKAVRHLAGTRVEFHGLQKAAPLNGTHGVVVGYHSASDRIAIRKEVAGAEEAATVTVKASNLRPASRLESLAAVQQLVDSAPPGGRVTLPRGEVTAAAADGDVPENSTLLLSKAITLAGMGSRTGGTVLGFSVSVGEDVVGELVELCGFHVKGGTVDVSPKDVDRFRLSQVSITAPQRGKRPALILEEIGRAARLGIAAGPCVVLDDCWVRGGSVGIMVDAAGCVMNRCRVQGAATYGVRSNALFSIEGCVVGECGTAGILARAGLTQNRNTNGYNENRVQRDQYDKTYSGYQDCKGCLGTNCGNCAAMYTIGSIMKGEGMIKWGQTGSGMWQNVGCP